MKAIALVELIRPINCVMALIATLIGYLIVSQTLTTELGAALVSVFLICAGGQAINDVYDSQIDARLKKNRPIPKKRITRHQAAWYSALLFVVGLFFSFALNVSAQIVAIIFTLLLILYASRLYHVKYIGNFIVALGTAFTFVYGALAAGAGVSGAGYSITIVCVLALSAFLANMARELIKDFEDHKKEKGLKKTLPMVSKKLAGLFVAIYYACAIVVAFYAFAIFQLSAAFFILTIIATILFFYSYHLFKENKMNLAQKMAKAGMLVSLIAFASLIVM